MVWLYVVVVVLSLLVLIGASVVSIVVDRRISKGTPPAWPELPRAWPAPPAPPSPPSASQVRRIQRGQDR